MAWKPLTPRRAWRRILWRLNRLLGRTRAADILYVRQLEGWLSRGCVAGIYDAVLAGTGPGEIAEVGSWKGKSTVAIGRAVLRRGGTEKVYAIDHHEGSVEQKGIIDSEGSTYPAFLETIEEGGVSAVVHPLKMDSGEAATWLSGRGVKLKFLFLDGSHEEEDVLRDLRLFVPLLLPGATLAMHDACPDGKHPGVWRAYRKVLGGKAEEVGWGGSVLLLRVADPSRALDA